MSCEYHLTFPSIEFNIFESGTNRELYVIKQWVQHKVQLRLLGMLHVFGYNPKWVYQLF